MSIGERIKQRRKEKKISVDFIARELGVSSSTVYRYEDSSIEKIPIRVFDKLCEILEVTPAELMGNSAVPCKIVETNPLPEKFNNPQDAMEFILKTPTLAAYGGYDPSSMTDEMIVEFANELLRQFRYVSLSFKERYNKKYEEEGHY
ncbi:helix-turn-helix domain-containing protein [Lachnobacterium bovis]|uniref:Helix-turn-helix domain-containing protein n=1 Tax=Lachnobacterium bovis DSM 14045 TaxID=1122142 RepID=A0A1H3LQH2_9FIRM|nr:helix-turn-helix transcriptional regulator [Lachnobacterium bovis]SDY66570.1 Helix-turn-helix domain-containing protein [Lachnobacterium bovis DSM 14045]